MRAPHAQLVGAVLENARTRERLAAYPAIERNFPPAVLDQAATAGPYYCHYMEWRLALLPDHDLALVNDLITLGERIPGWKQEAASLIRSKDFGTFWSLLWQLQVADLLTCMGHRLDWLAGGPDLLARSDTGIVYAECFVPRKGFDTLLFIEDLLRQVHPQLQIDRSYFLRKRTISTQDLEHLLGDLFGRLLAGDYLQAKIAQAELEWPVPIESKLDQYGARVFVEGPDTERYRPGLLQSGAGDPGAYYEVMLREAVSSKRTANKLRSHRPNVVFVNFLLGPDQQLAIALCDALPPDLGEAIDTLAWARCGINTRLSKSDLHFEGSWPF